MKIEWELLEPLQRGVSHVLARCSCGLEKRIRKDLLKSGQTSKCRTCANRERATKSGQRSHYLYSTWYGIKQRCGNPNHKSYARYGGRGIKMCDQWLNDSQAFIDYLINTLGDRPEGSSLDRIDNSLGYQPDNLRWATKKQQQNNRGTK